jgi:hypothetical protein
MGRMGSLISARFLALGSVCVLVGCGSPSGGSAGVSGSARVSGQLLGKTFAPVDAASYEDSGAFSFVLYDERGVCAELMANTVKANSSAVVFTVPDVTVGKTFPDVNAQFAEFDASCNSPAGESGYGSVTITASDAASVSGTFSFTLNGDTISGGFVAPTCANVAAGSGPQICN